MQVEANETLPITFPDLTLNFFEKDIELTKNEAMIKGELERLKQAKLDKEEPILSTEHDADNRLIWDAYQLVQKIQNEWESVVLAMPTGIDYDIDLKLKIQRKRYYATTVFDRAWELKALIDAIIETGYQRKSLFGDYDKIFNNIGKSKEKEACRGLRSLCMRLEKCLPRSVDIITPMIRTPHVNTHAEVTNE